MTRSLNGLHPTPNAEALAGMEMQPDQYDVLSLGSNYSRPSAEECHHARARVVFAFGKGVTRDELNALAMEAVADLHAFLETKHVVRLDYQPGTGDGPVPPDAALDAITDGEAATHD